MLRASLPACTEVHAAGDLPTLDHLAVELGPLPPGGLPGALDPRIKVPGGPCSVGELAQLRLGFRVTWPLSMLLEESVLQQYNAVTVFLMQVRRGSGINHYRVDNKMSTVLTHDACTCYSTRYCGRSTRLMTCAGRGGGRARSRRLRPSTA